MTEAFALPATELAGTSRALNVIRALLDRLRDDTIPYCHWKSNEHLDLSLIGESDLDILVARNEAQRFSRVVAELGFKRFIVKPGLGYPGIEDYIGFDQATGALTHLHVHYQLTLGEKFLKGHRLPWEDAVLSTRVLDPVHDAFVSDTGVEALLLLTRAAMKLRTRDMLFAAAGAAYVSGSQLRELRWLAARVEHGRLLAIARPLVGDDAARHLPQMLAGPPPTIRQLRAFRRAARPRWSEHRMYGPGEALLRRWQREVAKVLSVARTRLRGAALRSSTRTAPQGGLLVAIVGADGAGKSTVTQEIASWLSREVAVLPLYGGSGTGPASLTRRLLQLVAAAARRIRRQTRRDNDNGNTAPPSATAPEPARGARSLAYAAWALSLARERRRAAKRARRARDRGMVVIADRYPQRQFGGLNDGPKLWGFRTHSRRLLRWAAAREEDAYAEVERLAPDVVIKLLLPATVALRRKPDTPVEQLKRKIQIVSALRYPPGTRVVEIDATRPLQEVVLRTKQAVWHAL
jgi:thymidylate kinase